MAPTIKKLVAVNKIKADSGIKLVKNKKYYYLSEMQKLNWKRHKKNDYFKIYDNLLLRFNLIGKLDVAILNKSLNEIINRHESFRTNYKTIKGQVFQTVRKNASFKATLVDLSRLSKKDQQQEIEKIIKEENDRGFDVSKDLLIRVKIVKLSDIEHVLIMSVDHISFDEESIGILLRELSVLYNSYLQKKPIILPKIALQYKDYAEWEQNNLKKQNSDKQKKYWVSKFKSKIPALDLPYDDGELSKNFRKQKVESISFEFELFKKIETYCANNNTTLNIFFFSIFNLLLFKITNQSDLIVTSLLSTRNDIRLEKTIGLLFVPLAIRTKINKEIIFSEFIKNVKNNILEDFTNKDFPFSEAVKEADQRIYPSQYPNIFFQFYEKSSINFRIFSGLQMTEAKIYEKEETHFDLCMKIKKTENSLKVFLYFKKGAFKSSTINRFLAVFKELSEESISNSDKKLKNIIE